MINFKLSSIVEHEIVVTALSEYRQSMLKLGNTYRADKVLDIMSRLDPCFGCSDDCSKCDLLDLNECGCEANCSH